MIWIIDGRNYSFDSYGLATVFFIITDRVAHKKPCWNLEKEMTRIFDGWNHFFNNSNVIETSKKGLMELREITDSNFLWVELFLIQMFLS